MVSESISIIFDGSIPFFCAIRHVSIMAFMAVKLMKLPQILTIKAEPIFSPKSKISCPVAARRHREPSGQGEPKTSKTTLDGSAHDGNLWNKARNS